MYDWTKKRKTRIYYQMLLACDGKDFWDKVYEEDTVPMKEECISESKKCIYPARATRRKKNAKYKRHLIQTYRVMKKNEARRLETLRTWQTGFEEPYVPYLRLERMCKRVKKRKLIV